MAWCFPEKSMNEQLCPTLKPDTFWVPGNSKYWIKHYVRTYLYGHLMTQLTASLSFMYWIRISNLARVKSQLSCWCFIVVWWICLLVDSRSRLMRTSPFSSTLSYHVTSNLWRTTPFPYVLTGGGKAKNMLWNVKGMSFVYQILLLCFISNIKCNS